jgi:hypothetical protein
MLDRVRTLVARLSGASIVFGFVGQAAALEYCVTCEGPPALYRCVIDGTADGPGNDPTASLFCISSMANKGHHETCAVSRGAPFPCPGLTAVVKQPAGQHQTTAPPPAAPAPAEALPPPPEKQAEPTQPAPVPRTVEELAGQTVKSSKESLEKAGEAIGGTAKKAGEQIGNAGSAIGNAASQTWTCITSLFSSCSPPSEPPAQDPAPESPPRN